MLTSEKLRSVPPSLLSLGLNSACPRSVAWLNSTAPPPPPRPSDFLSKLEPGKESEEVEDKSGESRRSGSEGGNGGDGGETILC